MGDDWKTRAQDDLADAIREFKAALPGWYYSVCECQVSCDATIAPTTESQDIELISADPRFDSGFMVDLPQPSTLAEALLHVMREALEARARGQLKRAYVDAEFSARAMLPAHKEE